jgi:hypothetical protein
VEVRGGGLGLVGGEVDVEVVADLPPCVPAVGGGVDAAGGEFLVAPTQVLRAEFLRFLLVQDVVVLLVEVLEDLQTGQCLIPSYCLHFITLPFHASTNALHRQFLFGFGLLRALAEFAAGGLFLVRIRPILCFFWLNFDVEIGELLQVFVGVIGLLPAGHL